MTTMTRTLSSLQTGHVALNVSDLARSQRFYEQVFGLQEQQKGSDGGQKWVFLGRDGRLWKRTYRCARHLFSTAIARSTALMSSFSSG